MNLTVIKRSGELATYSRDKITNAITKSFEGCNSKAESQVVENIVSMIESEVQLLEKCTVEGIQDIAEKMLMKAGYYDVAKSYILYREHRTKMRLCRENILSRVSIDGLADCLLAIEKDFRSAEYSLNYLDSKFTSLHKAVDNDIDAMNTLIKSAVELTTPEAPKWEFISARLMYLLFSVTLEKRLANLAITNFTDKLRYLCDNNLYGRFILDSYTIDELNQAYSMIDNSRNNLLTYAGLDLIIKRYVVQNHQRQPMETPQEMYLGIALHLAMNETCDRMMWVNKFYNILSEMQATMATPTLSNARKPYHQLSSCFIDTVPDSLDGIYRSLDNFAKVSKMGGGMGLYFGKVRASGSAIRSYEGAAGGIIRWIRLVNDTAVAVDQLGMRQGAVAVYLDAWHRDLPEFLQLRTNNGDDRTKAHDIFPALCYPDLFWRLAEQNLNQSWYLMCPHQISTIKGYHLEDYYGEEWERRYFDCVNDSRITKREFVIKDLVRLILKSAVETGTPFAFNRDLVNKYNPNGHRGMIYCSNLCTEIAQNMSAIEQVSTEVVTENGDTVIVSTTKPGDFVVCNLASLSLGHIDVNNSEKLEDIVATLVRALDNVIDLNMYPLPYAEITNHKYRSIGLGVSGYHHMLAKCGVRWESDQHLQFVDRVFEDINYYAVKASCNLAKQKGSYSLFEGSDWNNGDYFTKRNYTSDRWVKLRNEVAHGMRNAYLMAVAPTSSTSILAGTTAGIDPVMNKFYLEEKKGVMLPRVAPELNSTTMWLYKNAHNIDQHWSIKACGIRQRHIDQAQSINLYITNDYTMRQVLDLYIDAWKKGVKTIYYIRSKSLEVTECESCAS